MSEQYNTLIGKQLRTSQSFASASNRPSAAALVCLKIDDIGVPSILTRFSHALFQHVCATAFYGGTISDDADPCINIFSSTCCSPSISLSSAALAGLSLNRVRPRSAMYLILLSVMFNQST